MVELKIEKIGGAVMVWYFIHGMVYIGMILYNSNLWVIQACWIL